MPEVQVRFLSEAPVRGGRIPLSPDGFRIGSAVTMSPVLEPARRRFFAPRSMRHRGVFLRASDPPRLFGPLIVAMAVTCSVLPNCTTEFKEY